MKYTYIAFIVSTLVSSASEPERLSKLRSSYEGAVERATAPLTKAYAQELDKLKTEYTRAGNLDAALAVAEEQKKYSSRDKNQIAPPSPMNGDAPKRLKQFKTGDDFLSWIAGTKWASDKGAFVYIRFVDASHFVWFDRKTQSENQPVEMHADKAGILKFRYSSGGEGAFVVSDDLKEMQLGSSLFKLERK